MFRVADFAKSSVPTENVYDEDSEEYERSPSPVPIVPHTQATGRYLKFPADEYEDYDDMKGLEFGNFDDKNLSYQQGDFKSSPGFDDLKLSNMNTLGFPTGFSVGLVEKQRKGEKKTFYCEMCLIVLSSN